MYKAQTRSGENRAIKVIYKDQFKSGEMDAVKNLEGHYHRNVITTFSFKDCGSLKLLELECASEGVWFYYFLFL